MVSLGWLLREMQRGLAIFSRVILASLVELKAWVLISGFWVISFGRRVPLIPSGVPTFPRVVVILFWPSSILIG